MLIKSMNGRNLQNKCCFSKFLTKNGLAE